MFALIRGPSGRVATISPGLKASQLRRLIPAELLVVMLAEAAVTGQYRKFDLDTGEEIGASEPVPQAERIRLAERLLEKRLPSQKAAEEEAAPVSDLAKITLNPEDIKRMSLSELGSVIDATYTIEHTKDPLHVATQPPEPGPGPTAPGVGTTDT